MNLTHKNLFTSLLVVIVAVAIGYVLIRSNTTETPVVLDATPQNVTLSGTYVCLPHLDTSGPQTEECTFGLKTDNEVYYAVNFGASAQAMEQFQSGAHVTAEGSVVMREALSSDHWAKYNMKGIFTITRIIEPTPTNGKLNIDVVCQSALVYMSFPDAASANLFVEECKEGKHPEVIERYRKDMNLGDGATI